MTKLVLIGAVLFNTYTAQAELTAGGLAVPAEVLALVSTHLAAECPRMYEGEMIDITTYRTYKVDQGIRMFEIGIMGRGYAVNDPHWDMSYQLETDLSLGELVITNFQNRGDCW